MTREQAIDLLWHQNEQMLFLEKEQFVRHFDGWYLLPLEVKGDPAFAFLTKGAEFHVANLGTKHRVPVKAVLARVQQIVDEHGYAITRTPIEDDRQHRFNLASGFEIVGVTEFDTIFRFGYSSRH